MEEWDVYDQHRIKTGKIAHRGDRLGADEYHLVVHVCIINAKHQMLIQQRQPFKKGWPNKWDVTIGGSAHAGENSQQAAQREVFEEIGYSMDLCAARPIFTINFKKGFDDFYVIEANPDLNQLSLQEAEVKAIKWATKEEILKMIEAKEFIPYHTSLIEMIFDMKSAYGAHRRD